MSTGTTTPMRGTKVMRICAVRREVASAAEKLNEFCG